MQLLASNLVTQNRPSFQARLVYGRGTNKAIERTLADRYLIYYPESKLKLFGKNLPTAKQICLDFKQAFEAFTKGIKGTVKLIPIPNDKDNLMIVTYQKGPFSKSLKSFHTVSPEGLMSNVRCDEGAPFSSAVRCLSLTLSDLLGKEGKVGYGNHNPFHLLLAYRG